MFYFLEQTDSKEQSAGKFKIRHFTQACASSFFYVLADSALCASPARAGSPYTILKLHKMPSRSKSAQECLILSYRVYTSKGRIVILGQIVSASGQIFRPDFCPQDKIFWPGMAFRPLDESLSARERFWIDKLQTTSSVHVK